MSFVLNAPLLPISSYTHSLMMTPTTAVLNGEFSLASVLRPSQNVAEKNRKPAQRRRRLPSCFILSGKQAPLAFLNPPGICSCMNPSCCVLPQCDKPG
jgi:hypothetical protein